MITLKASKTNSHAFVVVVIFALASVLSGCGGTTVEKVVSGPFPYIQMAPNAPPQAKQEVRPSVGTLSEVAWRPGYWKYTGMDFSWVPGEYISKPDPTASWSPDRWELREYGWTFVPGCWQ